MPLLLLFVTTLSLADIPTDANGYNIDPNAFNYLPLALGLVFAIGATVAYFTYKNQKNAVQ